MDKDDRGDVMDDDMARVFRSMTGAERLKIANDMFVSARRMIASHLAAEHPDWDQERIERETSQRILQGDVSHLDFEEIRQGVLKHNKSSP